MRLRHLLPALLFAAIAVAFAVGLGLDPKRVPSPLIDKPAPVFALPPLLDGVPGLATADLAGKVALVNVFASWCLPCRAEHPLLMRLAESEGVTVFGINYKDKPEDARAWLAELGNPYRRIGIDRDGKAGIEWGVYGVPESFVVDAQGRIRYKWVGPLAPNVLEEKILPILREVAE